MKKELTVTQKKNKYNRISKITYLSQYVAMAAPYIAIGIANYDKYFVEVDGTKMSISFAMALAVLGYTIWSTTNKKLENTLWPTVIKMFILAFICFLMGQLITDLGTIFLFGGIGMVGSETLNSVSKNYAKKRDLITEATEEAKKEMIKEEVKKEVNIGGII